MSDVLKTARQSLAAEQDAYRHRRDTTAILIRKTLPHAQVLADEIRRTFINAMESGLLRGGETEFLSAGERSAELQRELAMLLAENGFEPDALFDRPMCRRCADTGYVGANMCECLRERLSDARGAELSALGVNGKTFENYDLGVFSRQIEPEWGISQRDNMEGNVAYCRSWAKNFSPSSHNLFLNGGTGQGKTFLCACIAKRVADSGFSVKYTTAVSMFNDMEDKRFDRGTPDTGVYYTGELLIIDDLGTEMTTAFVQSALYDLINSRLTSGKKTIVNANLTAAQLAGRYMPQICSRLLGEFKSLHFFGPDLRMK